MEVSWSLVPTSSTREPAGGDSGQAKAAIAPRLSDQISPAESTRATPAGGTLDPVAAAQSFRLAQTNHGAEVRDGGLVHHPDLGAWPLLLFLSSAQTGFFGAVAGSDRCERRVAGIWF